jgi:hypothetical protein
MIRGPLIEASERLAPGAPPATGVATWYVQKGSNDTWFRCDAPAAEVGGSVSYIKERNLDRGVQFPNRDTGIPWLIRFLTEEGFRVADTKASYLELCKGHQKWSDLEVVFPEHQGAAVWTRPCGARGILAQAMREQGILTVAETDDNYFADAKFLLRNRQVGWGDKQMETVCRSMCSMDRNVFSTSWLRDRYWKEYKARLGKQHLPEMLVCRNHIPRSAWPERDHGDGPVRVGFMGSNSHVWDINVAYGAFHAVKNLTQATTTMIGYNPAEPDREPDTIELDGETVALRSEKSKDVRAKWRRVVDTHIPWIDPGDYRRAALPLDIGLAPLLEANDFTNGKSDAKAIEYTISGAAVVCSSSGIYGRAGWKHEVNCLMASTWRDYADQTLRLVTDPKLRFELVTAAQEMVWNERNETHLREEWEAALT